MIIFLFWKMYLSHINLVRCKFLKLFNLQLLVPNMVVFIETNMLNTNKKHHPEVHLLSSTLRMQFGYDDLLRELARSDYSFVIMRANAIKKS